MAHCRSLAPLGSEFDSFLFAPIGEDRNGTLLSVVSALARLDVDPWQEAGELTRLPRQAAIERLASCIAALPDGPSAPPAPVTIAARLIALLPSQVRPNITPPHKWPSIGEASNSRVVSYAIMIVMAFILGAQLIMASRQPQARIDNPNAPLSGTVLPQAPPPISSQYQHR
jgi:hypothetical protein